MLKILKPGLQTSIQDQGRMGYQKYGVIAAGAMDPLAHRLANVLVGNEEKEGTIEVTLLGPVIEFTEASLIAVCGGDLSPKVNGKPVRRDRPVYIEKGSILSFGKCRSGCRAYLAAAGGFDIQPVMGSYSTYLRAGIGGFKGRALQAGDMIKVKQESRLSAKIIARLKQKAYGGFAEPAWHVSLNLASAGKRHRVRVLEGLQYEQFTLESRESFWNCLFKVTADSDRMGYRLDGPKLQLKENGELISEAVSFGSIQVPGDGNPIVLLADRQTTGGYPKIGQIAAVDLPAMAQAKPGDSVGFEKISLEEAQRLYIEREKCLKMLQIGIQAVYR